MRELSIIRGLPGSGKSTLARGVATHGFVHHEADEFFIDAKGVYRWDQNKIGYAHKWCLGNCAYSLQMNQDVVVSNTFTTIREIESYLRMANSFSDVSSEVPDITITECLDFFGSVHDISDFAFRRMQKRWVYNEQLREYLSGRSEFDNLSITYITHKNNEIIDTFIN